ncbi:MAG: N-acetylmuramoyl-L-alanine amidase [Dysgonamonadaceae bacterium]|nr:N-acetylmuramoyl-L-alanine amidase [Dysgonamonadaceae bacterium]
MNLKLVLFILAALLAADIAIYPQDRDKPREGEGVYAFLRRNNRNEKHFDEFIRLNKNKLGRGNSLLQGFYYTLPPLETDSSAVKSSEKPEKNSGQKSEKRTSREPLFGPKYEEYEIVDDALKGACFFLVSGHGGPDSGAIALVDGHSLHEDEYAYDIVLRLARNLLQHGATVHILIQDKKDGIRDGLYLDNSKRETCMGKEIPLNQKKRLEQRADKINSLSSKAKEKYKRAIFIHLDSRSKKQQLDVFFYHQSKDSNLIESKNLAETMRKTFASHYDKHQPGRGFSGTVSSRSLLVLKNTKPVSIFVELANMQNKADQRRYILENNRQALANWLTTGFIKDFNSSK